MCGKKKKKRTLFFFLFQALTAFKQTSINGRRCLAIAYEVASTYLTQPIEGGMLLNELKEQPNATKGRLHFLSPESDTDYFRITNGKVVVGKAIVKRCVSIPLPDIPKEFLRAVKGNCIIDLSTAFLGGCINYCLGYNL